MAVKRRFLNERSGTMFNSNRPKLTVLQSDQGCVTVFDLCIARGIVPGRNLPVRHGAAFAASNAEIAGKKISAAVQIGCAVAG